MGYLASYLLFGSTPDKNQLEYTYKAQKIKTDQSQEKIGKLDRYSIYLLVVFGMQYIFLYFLS